MSVVLAIFLSKSSSRGEIAVSSIGDQMSPFGGQMLRVGGASAVAEEDDFIAVFDCGFALVEHAGEIIL